MGSINLDTIKSILPYSLKFWSSLHGSRQKLTGSEIQGSLSHHFLANEIVQIFAHVIVPSTSVAPMVSNLSTILLSPSIRFVAIPIRVKVLNTAHPDEFSCKEFSPFHNKGPVKIYRLPRPGFGEKFV